MTLLWDISIFDCRRDGAIICGFLRVGAVRITASGDIGFKFGEAMRKVLKRIKIEFDKVQHREAGGVRDICAGGRIFNQIRHGIERDASCRMLTAGDLFGKYAGVQRKRGEKRIHQGGFTNAGSAGKRANTLQRKDIFLECVDTVPVFRGGDKDGKPCLFINFSISCRQFLGNIGFRNHDNGSNVIEYGDGEQFIQI